MLHFGKVSCEPCLSLTASLFDSRTRGSLALWVSCLTIFLFNTTSNATFVILLTSLTLFLNCLFYYHTQSSLHWALGVPLNLRTGLFMTTHYQRVRAVLHITQGSP